MKVIALLSFYDENPEMLTEMVEACAKAGIESIVAVDGAYAEYANAIGLDGALAASTGPEQAQAIRDAASAHSMEYVVHVPSVPWPGGETEKRSFVFALGHERAEVGVDWFWVIDADVLVETREPIAQYLAGIPEDIDVVELQAVETHGSMWMLRQIFRSQPTGIRLGKYHAHYVTGDGRSLWASCHRHLEVPAAPIDPSAARCLHRPGERDGGLGGIRNRNKRQYYERAVMLGFDEAVI